MSSNKNVIHWAVLVQLRASDSGCWADPLFVGSDGHKLDCLQTVDKWHKRNFTFAWIFILSSTCMVYVHTCTHFLEELLYKCIALYYKNLTTGMVGWGSSIHLIMSCIFNTQISSIKFLLLYWKQVIETWSFLSLKIWHLAYTWNM